MPPDGQQTPAVTQAPIWLVSKPEPFRSLTLKEIMPEGWTIAHAVLHAIPRDVVCQAHVRVNGDYIPPDMWLAVKPKPGSTVRIDVMPGKSGSASPIATILSLALMVAAPYAGAMLGTALGSSLGFMQGGILWNAFGTVTWSTIGRGIFSAVGSLLINALSPPPKPKRPAASSSDKATLFITGAQNQVLRYGAIPRPYGRFRMVPPLGALPYTETVGSDQYVRMLVIWGHGPLNISDIRIGDTSIANFDNVEIETVQGFTDDPDLTLFPNIAIQNDLSVALNHDSDTYVSTAVSITGGDTINLPGGHGLSLDNLAYVKMEGWSTTANNEEFTVTAASGNTITIGGGGLTNDAGGEEVTLTLSSFQVRTTPENVDEISIDITFPRGLVKYLASGIKKELSVEFNIQYAPTGTNSWSNGVGFGPYSLTVSPEMPAPNTGSASEPDIYIYRVYIDPASLNLGVVRGPRFRTGRDEGVPEAPLIPDGMIALAKVERRKGDPDDVPADRITDERDLTLVGEVFEDAGSLEPGTTATNDCISIAAGGIAGDHISVTEKKAVAVRRNLRFKVPRGTYDVRLVRITEDSDDDKIIDQAEWTALRCFRNEHPVNATFPLAMSVIRIKATDQLNGSVPQINGVVHSILPDWDSDSSTWIERETSNPASIFRDILQGTANRRPLADTRINLDALAVWHENNEDAGREFNAIIDGQGTVRDTLDDVAAVGRATAALVDGVWQAVEDKPQAAPAQHFAARNVRGFRGVKVFPDLPHAFIVEFFNRSKDWQPDERIVYDDGYSKFGEVAGTVAATKFERLQLFGVDNPDQAWKEGRYHIACARLRPENFSFATDFEHLKTTRGDLVRVAHDVIVKGLGSGRIKSLQTSGPNITGITLDETVTMEIGKNYGVEIRVAHDTEIEISAAVTTVSGSTKALVFSTPIAIAADPAPAVGDQCMFGEVGQISEDCIIKGIEGGDDLSALISLVAAAPGVHSAHLGAIPDHNSGVTTPPDLQRPPQPIVSAMQSGAEALIRAADGTLTSTIVVTLEPPVFSLALTLTVLIKGSDETTYLPAQAQFGTNQATIFGVDPGARYDIKLIYKNPNGLASLPKIVTGYLVEGGTANPDPVDDLTCNILDGAAYLSWGPPTNNDVTHARVKFSEDLVTPTWGSSIDLVTRVSSPATSITVPALVGSYLVKWVNASGLESEGDPAYVISNIAGVAGFNAVESVTESPTFPGTHDDTVTDGTGLYLGGSDSIDDWLDVDDVVNFDVGDSGVVEDGAYDFDGIVDLTVRCTSRITASIEVEGVDLYNNFDTYENIDLVEDIDAAVDPSHYVVQLQIAITDDDPNGVSPDWSEWMNFVIGDYTARGIKFRVLLGSLVAGISPYITQLSVAIDMPDRVASNRNLTSNSADSPTTDILFAPAFKATPAIGITAEGMATGDFFTITAQTSTGFSIIFKNSAGTRVTRVFDWLARGYGEVV